MCKALRDKKLLLILLCELYYALSAHTGRQSRPDRGEINKEVPKNMAKAGSRVKVTLRCAECKQRNYNTMKNKKNTTEKLELSKYCPFCRKHTKHVETK